MTDKTYMDDIAGLLAQIERRSTIKNPIVLYGSSSFKYWPRMVEDIGNLSLVNAGFGGSSYVGALEHYERVLKPLNPSHIFIYFGENDIASEGQTAEQTLVQHQQFHKILRADFPSVKITYLGIKTGPSRWLWHQEYQKYNSQLAKNLESDPHAECLDVMSCLLGDNGLPAQKFFIDDGIHLSPLGYAQWAPLFRQKISTNP